MIYVDDLSQPCTVGTIFAHWSRLTANSPAELHEFAEQLGLPRTWFKIEPGGSWFYLVTQGKRREALRAGAITRTARALDQIMHTSQRAEMVPT